MSDINDVAEQTLAGKALQIPGASKPKLAQKCLANLWRIFRGMLRKMLLAAVQQEQSPRPEER